MTKSHSKKPLLDQFSTSPTGLVAFPSDSPGWCVNHAPFFAYTSDGQNWSLVQGCCNDWTCPRCGKMRAREEYGRIIEGCKQIAPETGLRFITITTRGRELSVKAAEDNYLEWTNRLLDACRQRAKRDGQKWCYVQVTERQKRKHPHSHLLTTFHPKDLYLGHVYKWATDAKLGRVQTRELALRSDWLQAQIVRSGLGEQYDISLVQTVEGAARYVAKYLFKDTIFSTKWPPGWRRVRYSQSFPKLAEKETTAIVLIKWSDWFELATRADTVTCTDQASLNLATNIYAAYPVKVRDKVRSRLKNS